MTSASVTQRRVVQAPQMRRAFKGVCTRRSARNALEAARRADAKDRAALGRYHRDQPRRVTQVPFERQAWDS
jgi:hypothetical protein